MVPDRRTQMFYRLNLGNRQYAIIQHCMHSAFLRTGQCRDAPQHGLPLEGIASTKPDHRDMSAAIDCAYCYSSFSSRA